MPNTSMETEIAAFEEGAPAADANDHGTLVRINQEAHRLLAKAKAEAQSQPSIEAAVGQWLHGRVRIVQAGRYRSRDSYGYCTGCLGPQGDDPLCPCDMTFNVLAFDGRFVHIKQERDVSTWYDVRPATSRLPFHERPAAVTLLPTPLKSGGIDQVRRH